MSADPRPGPGPKPAGPTHPTPTHPPSAPPPPNPVPAKSLTGVPPACEPKCSGAPGGTEPTRAGVLRGAPARVGT